jgi:hypothetical protein
LLGNGVEKPVLHIVAGVVKSADGEMISPTIKLNNDLAVFL